MNLVNSLEKQININPTDENLAQYNENKKLIENYNNTKAIGAQIRSKINWAEYGGKN
jgi:hypothetical protein